MTDKNRHRPTPTPKGHMPNWALVLCLASGFAALERVWQNPAVTIYAAHP